MGLSSLLWAQDNATNATKDAPVADTATQDAAATSGDEATIPEGTEFKLQLHTAISSKTSKAGDRVMTTLIDPVAIEDREVLAKGLRIDGHIGEVKAARRRGKGGYLTVIFDTLEMPNGEKVAILGSLTEVFSSEGGTDPTVGPEGDLKGRGASHKQQVAMVLVLPYFLPSNWLALSFGNWLIGRSSIAVSGLVLGTVFNYSLGLVVPGSLRFMPMTFLILASMVSCYIQFYGLIKLRLAK